MKILLICPSSIEMMPYVRNYISILRDACDLSIVIWDRLQTSKEKDGLFIYTDKKNIHKRGFYEYYNYVQYIKNLIDTNHFDKVIIFGIQLSFFLGRKICKKFKDNFLLDIRDWHPLIRFTPIDKIISCSKFTIISSPGFLSWLPNISNNIIIHHNISDTKSIISATNNKPPLFTSVAKIGSIGASRDFSANKRLIESVSNINNFYLSYHGKGTIDDQLKYLIQSLHSKNISMHGFYLPDEEDKLYTNYNFISVASYPDSINNSTLLPNRLYNSAYFGIPVIAFEGTVLANVVSENSLGICVNKTSSLSDQIIKFMENFDSDIFDRSRLKFLKKVFEENTFFKKTLINFAQDK